MIQVDANLAFFMKGKTNLRHPGYAIIVLPEKYHLQWFE